MNELINNLNERKRLVQENKDKRLELVHSLFLEKLIKLSNSQPELDLYYASRILTSNHSQSTILTPDKGTKAPNTWIICEYKPKRTLLLTQTRKSYFSML